jgi:hypothetical protein
VQAAEATAQVQEVKEFVPQTFEFAQHMHDYATRLGLPGPDPNIFFRLDGNRGATAVWNSQKQQYEVNPKFFKLRGLAEYVAIEGRFMAKHYARCIGDSKRRTDVDFWQDFRYSVTEYVLKTEQNLTGEGAYTGLPVESSKVYRLLKQVEAKSGGNTRAVRKLSLALLDQYDCDWTFRNVVQKVSDVNRKTGTVPDAVIVGAAKAAGL